MRAVAKWLALAGVVAAGAAFALANVGREVDVGFGLWTLRAVPVAFVAFGGMLAGMAVVLVAGIDADLKVRRLLNEMREADADDRRLEEVGAANAARPAQGTLAGIEEPRPERPPE